MELGLDLCTGRRWVLVISGYVFIGYHQAARGKGLPHRISVACLHGIECASIFVVWALSYVSFLVSCTCVVSTIHCAL